ncbi:MAG: SET domain-containing protein-lysine N-methyltransferase [Verrucomicrobia bacterium]|nr:SET domain-containing protein-lysine N-methyltransferase [Verrucomicrobiota bacterium]
MDSPNVVFKGSPIHGLGGFARVDLPAGLRVIEYQGQRITKQQSIEFCREGNPFVFRLDEESDLNGDVGWNPARYLNHSCSPNCEAELIEGKIWIVACRDIKAGEEVTFDYGYDLEDYREHPCQCGSPQCVGYIVAAELRDGVWNGQDRRGQEGW